MTTWIRFLLPLFGMLFCLGNLYGIELMPCETSGCEIYANYSLLGVPIYGWGAAAFLAAALAAVGHALKSTPRTRHLLELVILALLLGDALFLGYQILFWPCMNCLVVAAVIGAMVWLHFREEGWTRLARNCFDVWIILLVPVLASAGKELVVTPLAIAGDPAAENQVFFSPTCPACVEAVRQILQDPAASDKVAFIPVAKNDTDKRMISRFLESPGQALPMIFHPLPDNEGTTIPFGLHLKLARNKAYFASRGFTALPQIVAPAPIVVRVLPTAPQDFIQGIFGKGGAGQCGVGATCD